MTSEIGTLKELNVQVGDVVCNLNDGEIWTIIDIDEQGFHGKVQSHKHQIRLALISPYHEWKIVSRAIIDWSKVDRGTLVSTLRSNGSWRDGTTFLCYHKEVDDNREWIVASYKGDIPQSFKPDMVKLCPPPPVVTEHVGVVYAGNEQRTTTYQTVDGKVDWSTFKVNDK